MVRDQPEAGVADRAAAIRVPRRSPLSTSNEPPNAEGGWRDSPAVSPASVSDRRHRELARQSWDPPPTRSGQSALLARTYAGVTSKDRLSAGREAHASC